MGSSERDNVDRTWQQVEVVGPPFHGGYYDAHVLEAIWHAGREAERDRPEGDRNR